ARSSGRVFGKDEQTSRQEGKGIMCPVCVASMMLIAVGMTSSSGAAAFAVNKFYKKNEQTKSKEAKMKLKEIKPEIEAKQINRPRIVSPQKWEAARQQLLVKEKELTRARDALAAERRRMPWLAVEKNYEFDGPKGKASLL